MPISDSLSARKKTIKDYLIRIIENDLINGGRQEITVSYSNGVDRNIYLTSLAEIAEEEFAGTGYALKWDDGNSSTVPGSIKVYIVVDPSSKASGNLKG